MAERWITVLAPGGLHARLAARIVQLARAGPATLLLEYEGRRAEATSLTSLLALGVDAGSKLRIVSEGEGAEEALVRIEMVLRGGAGTGIYPGDGVSPGVATGRAVVPAGAAGSHPRVPPEERDRELGRVHAALDRARSQLAALEVWAEREIGAAGAVLRAERELLNDPTWLALLEDRIRCKGMAAEGAVWSLSREPDLTPPVAAGGPTNGLREMLRDVGDRLTRILVHQDAAAPGATEEGPIVLAARQVSPSELLEWPRDRLAAVVAALGGAQGHAALLARALRLPMVVGVGEELVEALAAKGRPGLLLTVDGSRGVVVVEPDEHRSAAPAGVPRRKPMPAHEAERPAILANADTPEEVRLALDAGAEGVGLARTERVFYGRELPPDEEEQYRAFRGIAAACDGRPLTVRMADLGGPKAPPYLVPLLGSESLRLRGAGLLARYPALARPHLRALARVAREAAMTIMVPMVAARDELDAVVGLWRDVAADVGAEARLSLLVETPAAALGVERLLSGLDQVAIGTNDLAAFLFGAERELGLTVARPALQPVMLRIVAKVAQSAHALGVPVTVCGEAAGWVPEAVVLWGLGVDEMSVAPERISVLAQVLAAVNGYEAQAVARAARDEDDVALVLVRLEEWRQDLASRGTTLYDWPEGWEGRGVEHDSSKADDDGRDSLGGGLAQRGQDGFCGTTDCGAQGPRGASGDDQTLS